MYYSHFTHVSKTRGTFMFHVWCNSRDSASINIPFLCSVPAWETSEKCAMQILFSRRWYWCTEQRCCAQAMKVQLTPVKLQLLVSVNSLVIWIAGVSAICPLVLLGAFDFRCTILWWVDCGSSAYCQGWGWQIAFPWVPTRLFWSCWFLFQFSVRTLLNIHSIVKYS